MRLYVGSRDYKPEGFLSVDIDPVWGADIVGDITNLHMVEDESVDEVVASHVLEHLAWPNSFLALTEFQRVLKPSGVLRVAIPDAGLLAELIASGKSSWHAVGLLFGVGRLFNEFEAHQFSYTQSMMCELLAVLGFSEFEHWNSDFPDASNGWQPIADGAKVAISLNISCQKTRAPFVDPKSLHEQFRGSMLSAVEEVIQGALGEERPSDSREPRTLVQSMHMQLITERQSAKHLQQTVGSLRATVESLSQLVKSLQEMQANSVTQPIAPAADSGPQTFLLIVPCKVDDYAAMIETMNSLSAQSSSSWSLVVVADMPCPNPIFDTTDFLGWLQVGSISDSEALSTAIHDVVEAVGSKWVSVMSAGTTLPEDFIAMSSERASASGAGDVLFFDECCQPSSIGVGLAGSSGPRPARAGKFTTVSGRSCWYRADRWSALGGR